MISEIKKLMVKHNEKTVGYLAVLNDGKIGFQYDEAWRRDGFSISPFSLPLSDKIYINQKNTFDGLYGVFYDSLPDGWGELLVKRMLAKKDLSYDRLSPLTKLALISANGPGGLTYEPSLAECDADPEYDLDLLLDDVRHIFDNEQQESVDLDKLFRLGGSSGGAWPKVHIKVDGEDWIVKFPCRIDPENTGEKEVLTNQIAQKCGISVNTFHLFPSGRCTGYFGSKRFDRIGNRRIHMISLSAILETTHRIPNLDYIHLFQVIQNICVGKYDGIEAFRRMAFNVLYGNKDDHGKNFSFLYDEEIGGYRLSPAYDITRTTYMLEHEMTVAGNGLPGEADMLKVAEKMSLPMKKCRLIIQEIKSLIL